MKSAAFWQIWMLLSAAMSGVLGARLRENPQTLEARPIVAQLGTDAPRAEKPRRLALQAAAPSSDWLLQRLDKAETGSELCELLGRLEPTEDPRATYAITGVLERTRLRSVRACATSALAVQPTPAAHSWLVDLAEDPEPEVHRAALEALALQTDVLAETTLSDAAHSADVDVRLAAVIALLKARRAETFALAKDLSETLDDPAKLGELVDALAESGDVRVLPVLQALITRGDRETHVRAISALGVLGAKQAAALLWPYLQVGSAQEFAAAANALVALEPESVLPKLTALLHHGKTQRRSLALSALTRLKLPGATVVLASLLDSDEPELLAVALRHLARTHDPAFESRFVELARGDQPSLQQAALQALAQLGTPGALAELRAFASGGTDELAQLARDALSTVPEARAELQARRIEHIRRKSADESGEREVIPLASDPSPEAQAAVLGYFSGAERPSELLARAVMEAPSATVAELAARVQQSGDLEQRRALTMALANRAEPRFSAELQRAANDEDEAIRRTALRGLLSLGDERASQRVTGLLDAPESGERQFAIEQLATRADDASLAKLEALTSDQDSDVAEAALSALKERAPAHAAKLAQSRFERASPEEKSTILDSLGGLRSALTRPLYEAGLSDPNDETALRSIELLAGLEGPSTAQRLLGVARDAERSQEVRGAAASALRQLGGPWARQNQPLLDQLSPREMRGSVICRSAS